MHKSPGGFILLIMLVYINVHGIVKMFYIAFGEPLCTFTFKMYNGCSGKIMVFHSGIMDPITKVNIIAIHKKIFIKAINGFNGLFL